MPEMPKSFYFFLRNLERLRKEIFALMKELETQSEKCSHDARLFTYTEQARSVVFQVYGQLFHITKIEVPWEAGEEEITHVVAQRYYDRPEKILENLNNLLSWSYQAAEVLKSTREEVERLRDELKDNLEHIEFASYRILGGWRSSL
jgi:archaellum component FlaC